MEYYCGCVLVWLGGATHVRQAGGRSEHLLWRETTEDRAQVLAFKKHVSLGK